MITLFMVFVAFLLLFRTRVVPPRQIAGKMCMTSSSPQQLYSHSHVLCKESKGKCYTILGSAWHREVFKGLAFANGRNFYRRDYVYSKEFDAFYKIHWNPNVTSWTDAFKTCDDEGAQLFSPREDLEWAIVNNLTGTLPGPLNISEVIVGIRDQSELGVFVHVDGQLAPADIPKRDQCGSGPCCVHMRIDTGSFEAHSCDLSESIPFVCKKVDSPCPTIDREYIYNKDLRKYYKVHKEEKTWQEAYHNCYQEGAMLLVVDNKLEAEHISTVIERSKYYHAGFYNIDDKYYTITGKHLENVYKNWVTNNQELKCGSVMASDGTLYTEDYSCGFTQPFVCEMNETITV